MQKDTQPGQTCSKGYTFMLLYVTGVFLRIQGVLIRLDWMDMLDGDAEVKRCRCDSTVHVRM